MYDWEENAWTYRLCYGMCRLFPNSSVYNTAEDGLQWGRNVLDKLGLEPIFFLLRGAPDVLSMLTSLLTLPMNPGISDDDSSRDEITLIKNSHQPTRLNSHTIA